MKSLRTWLSRTWKLGESEVTVGVASSKGGQRHHGAVLLHVQDTSRMLRKKASTEDAIYLLLIIRGGRKVANAVDASLARA